MEKIISEILKDLCISPALHGYSYLRYAIELTIKDPKLMHSISKELYPLVAKHFGSTPSRVERTMRHAIMLAWEEPYSPARDAIFRYSVRASLGNPTNGQFIATVADYLYTTGRVKYDEAC